MVAACIVYGSRVVPFKGRELEVGEKETSDCIKSFLENECIRPLQEKGLIVTAVLTDNAANVSKARDLVASDLSRQPAPGGGTICLSVGCLSHQNALVAKYLMNEENPDLSPDELNDKLTKKLEKMEDLWTQDNRNKAERTYQIMLPLAEMNDFLQADDCTLFEAIKRIDEVYTAMATDDRLSRESQELVRARLDKRSIKKYRWILHFEPLRYESVAKSSEREKTLKAISKGMKELSLIRTNPARTAENIYRSPA
ncbi:hypothetical protein FOZ62_018009, partial [Perkinsus olseni]